MTERVNITLPRELLERLDEAAASEHATRSGFIRTAVMERIGGVGGARAAAPSATPAAVPSTAAPAVLPSREEAVALLKAFFAARDDVEAAYLFGSLARGGVGPLSDVDVAVLLDRELDGRGRFDRQLDLAGRLAEVLEVERVDVVVLNDAGVALAHQAVVSGQLIMDRNGRAAEFELAALARYEDYLPAIEAHQRALAERIRADGFARR